MSAITAAGRTASIVSLAEHRRGRWLPADALWEQLALAGVEAMLAGQPDRAWPSFQAAARLAETGFAPDDPRRASALTNLARCVRSRGGDSEALFATAAGVWDRAGAWTQRVGVGDDAMSPRQCLRLVEEGRRYSLALATLRPLLVPCGLARWRAWRGRDALRRRLLSAVFLSTFQLAAPNRHGLAESNLEERNVAKR